MPIDTETTIEEISVTKRAVLMLLLDHYPTAWTRDEITRELALSPVDTEDTLVALAGAGLIHGRDDVVWATRAAQVASELL